MELKPVPSQGDITDSARRPPCRSKHLVVEAQQNAYHVLVPWPDSSTAPEWTWGPASRVALLVQVTCAVFCMSYNARVVLDETRVALRPSWYTARGFVRGPTRASLVPLQRPLASSGTPYSPGLTPATAQCPWLLGPSCPMAPKPTPKCCSCRHEA